LNQATFVNQEIAALVRLGLYANREEVIADAVRHLLLNNRSLRLELGLDLFQRDEVSLGRAAEVAGLDRWQFETILRERSIPRVIESESAESMDAALTFFFEPAHDRR
jgi:predicted HTH domain antitoxin